MRAVMDPNNGQFSCKNGADEFNECAKIAQIDFFMESSECGYDAWSFDPDYSYRPEQFEVMDCELNQENWWFDFYFEDWLLVKVNKPPNVDNLTFVKGTDMSSAEWMIYKDPVNIIHHPRGDLKSLSTGIGKCKTTLTGKITVDADNRIEEGSSGAPVIDSSGELVGVLKSAYDKNGNDDDCDDDTLYFTWYGYIRHRIAKFLGYAIEIENKTFSTGTEISYSAPESITIRSNVTLEPGSKVTITAPKTIIKGNANRRSDDGFHAKGRFVSSYKDYG